MSRTLKMALDLLLDRSEKPKLDSYVWVWETRLHHLIALMLRSLGPLKDASPFKPCLLDLAT